MDERYRRIEAAMDKAVRELEERDADGQTTADLIEARELLRELAREDQHFEDLAHGADPEVGV